MSAAPQPSLFSQLVLAEKYGGMRLTMDQLAEALGMARGSVYNQVSAGPSRLPPTSRPASAGPTCATWQLISIGSERRQRWRLERGQ